MCKNVWEMSCFQVLEIRPTALRENALYYKVYCIGLNTTFASVIPLLSLIYLNIATVLGEINVLAAIPPQ